MNSTNCWNKAKWACGWGEGVRPLEAFFSFICAMCFYFRPRINLDHLWHASKSKCARSIILQTDARSEILKGADIIVIWLKMCENTISSLCTYSSSPTLRKFFKLRLVVHVVDCHFLERSPLHTTRSMRTTRPRHLLRLFQVLTSETCLNSPFLNKRF